MNKNICILLVFMTLISCFEKKDKSIDESKNECITLKELNLFLKTNENLKEWFDYYKSKDSTFKIADFVFESKDTLDFVNGNVLGLFDKNFDKVYTDFLVFSADKNKYIDFDSYYWSLDDKKRPLFDIAQEINLVDLTKKSITRIGFRTSSGWVENAFWENDTTIILLENNTEKCPRITKVVLNDSQSESFKYKRNLSFESKYQELRLKKKGLKY